MVYCCKNCGVSNRFSGYREYTEWGSEGILVDADDEIVDYFDKDVTDSESGSRTIEKCEECDSNDIVNIPEEEYEEWKEIHFDKDGNFNKEGANTTSKPNNPGNFKSLGKLMILNDDLLSNRLSISEYRQKVEEYRKEMKEVKQ